MNKKPERLGDAPIEPKYVEQMNAVAQTLDRFFNGDAKGDDKKVGFILMLFPFGADSKGETGRTNYISNANRADVVTMLKEQIKRFEGQPDMKGHA